MPRFDEHEASSSRLAAFRRAVVITLTGNPGIVLSTLFVTSVAMLAAMVSISIAIAVPSALRSAFVSNPVLVFAVPGATRTEIETLDSRLKALPMVADVSFRSKGAALAALIEAGLPAAADGRNPLPDAWTLHLRIREETREDPNFVTVVVGARDAIASLPGVERVKFDEGWVTLLDRLARAWSVSGLPSLAACLLVDAISVAIVYGLFARSLRLPDRRDLSPSKSVVASVSGLIVVVASGVAYLLSALLASAPGMAAMDLLKPMTDQAGLTLLIIVISTGVAMLIAAWLGTIFVNSGNSFSRSRH